MFLAGLLAQEAPFIQEPLNNADGRPIELFGFKRREEFALRLGRVGPDNVHGNREGDRPVDHRFEQAFFAGPPERDNSRKFPEKNWRGEFVSAGEPGNVRRLGGQKRGCRGGWCGDGLAGRKSGTPYFALRGLPLGQPPFLAFWALAAILAGLVVRLLPSVVIQIQNHPRTHLVLTNPRLRLIRTQCHPPLARPWLWRGIQKRADQHDERGSRLPADRIVCFMYDF